MGDWIILLSSREPHHACHSRTPFSRRQRGAGCIIRHYFVVGFHVAPSWSRGIGVRAQTHMGSSQFALRLHFLCSAIWQAGRDPAAFSPPGNPYGESYTQAHFHFACTWWLLFFCRASCFLSYRVLFMLKLSKMYLHSRHAPTSWWVSISCFNSTWLKLVVLWNKQAGPKLGQTECVPT